MNLALITACPNGQISSVLSAACCGRQPSAWAGRCALNNATRSIRNAS